MKKDHRFAAMAYDDRFSKKRKQHREIAEESPAEEEPEDVEVDQEGEEEEEEIDMDRVNELLGVQPEEDIDAWSDSTSEAPIAETSTKRLALLNYDWSKISAGDLMITFSSFLPEDGQLKSVTVYPSDFGKQRMLQEETEGPGDIFKPNTDVGFAEEETPAPTKQSKKKGAKEEPAKSKKPTRQLETQEWAVGTQEESALDLAKLRRYERERLKYYYAVLEFDSSKACDTVYEACNGFELEKTGIKIGKISLLRLEIYPRRLEVSLRAEGKMHREAIEDDHQIQLLEPCSDSHQGQLYLGRAGGRQPPQRDPVQGRLRRPDRHRGLPCTGHR